MENNNFTQQQTTENTAPMQTLENFAPQPAPVNLTVQDTEHAKVKKKSGNAFITVMLILVFLMLAALIALFVLSMRKNENDNKRIDELALAVNTVAETANNCQENIDAANETLVEITDFTTHLSSMMGGEFGETSENGVIIGMEYEIVSTEHISDAYISGDYSELTDEEIGAIELAEEVINEVIEDGMTDYEKEVAIYDWMFENINHDDGITVAIPTTGDYCDNPYGVLSTHKAVCVGYATTFRFFMQMLEIECMVVHDTYLSHSWNLVNIDGGWYHTDLYMDVDSIRYGSFNMTDDVCYMSHEWDTEFFPSANSTEYCYSVMSAVEYESLSSAATDIRNLIEGDEGATLTFKISGDDRYTVYQQLEIMASEADYYVMNSDISEYGYLYYDIASIDEECIYYAIQFEVYDFDYDDDYYGDYEELSDREYNQAYREIESAFEDFYETHEEGDYYDDWEDEDWYGDWEYEEYYDDIVVE